MSHPSLCYLAINMRPIVYRYNLPSVERVTSNMNFHIRIQKQRGGFGFYKLTQVRRKGRNKPPKDRQRERERREPGASCKADKCVFDV